MRGSKDEDEKITACTILISTSTGHKVEVCGVVAGRRLIVLCDEYPLQWWISEHKKEVLQAVEKTLPVRLRECRIYADTFK